MIAVTINYSTGILKILAIICFLVSCVIFLCTPGCHATPPSYTKMYPITAAVSGVSVAMLFTLLSLGIVKSDGCIKWEVIDFIFNVLDFVLMLTVSILTTIACNDDGYSVHRMSAPIGIVGAFLLVTSSTIWAVRMRSTRESSLSSEQGPEVFTSTQYRKSFVA